MAYKLTLLGCPNGQSFDECLRCLSTYRSIKEFAHLTLLMYGPRARAGSTHWYWAYNVVALSLLYICLCSVNDLWHIDLSDLDMHGYS